MKFLTDENIGLEVGNFLRRKGYDVKSVIEISPGISDMQVLQIAQREKRVLITSDIDFGELIYHKDQPHSGVILLRLRNQTNAAKISILQAILQRYKKGILHNFSVVTETKIRIRQPVTKN